MKDKRLKISFINYLIKNPEERFWQALRNWAKVKFVLTSTHFDPFMFNQKFMKNKKVEITNTFYLEEIRKFDKNKKSVEIKKDK